MDEKIIKKTENDAGRAEMVGGKETAKPATSVKKAEYSVGICDLEKDFRSEFRDVLESKTNFPDQVFKIETINSLNSLYGTLKTKKIDVLFFGPSWDKQSIQNFFERKGRDGSSTIFVWATTFVRVDEEAAPLIRAGLLKDYVRLPILIGDLVEKIRGYVAAATVSVPAVPSSPKAEAKKGAKSLIVFSPKGGVGKTIISTNLGVELARKGHKVVLIDLDLQFGDAGLVLDLKPQSTISDLCDPKHNSPLNSKDSALDNYITKHSSGLEILHAPLSPELADLVNSDHVRKIIELVKDKYDYVVFDTPATFNETVLAALDHADLILLVANLDLPCIKNIKLAMDTLDLLGIPNSKYEIVVNKFDSFGLDVEEVEEITKRSVSVSLPNDRNVMLAVNQGRPVITQYPRSPFTKAFEVFAKKVETMLGPVAPVKSNDSKDEGAAGVARKVAAAG